MTTATITIERSSLALAMARLARTVERRNTIPVLSSVRIEVEADGWLQLTATDLDIEAKAKLACDNPEGVNAATTAPAHLLHDILRKVADGPVTLTRDWASDTDTLVLKSGRSRFQLPVLPASDFPDFAAGDMEVQFALDAKILLKTFDQVAFAMSREETRYYLNGIYMAPRGGELALVATDGHRLSRLHLPLPKGAEAMPGIILPAKTVTEVARIAKDYADVSETFRVEVSPSKIRFINATTTLTSKLIDGTYPDYERVIPKNNELKVLVPREALQQAVDRVATISGDKGRAIALTLTKGALNLKMTNPDTGTAEDELEVAYDGPELLLGFNPSYLDEILRTMTGAEASFAMADGASPTLITDPERDEALIVLMPMRV